MQSLYVVMILSLVCCLPICFSQLSLSNPLNAPDMPGFTANYVTIPAGSLIIPMDPANQVTVSTTGLLSVLPYGLVVRTLHANISVWWCIKTGKNLGDVDVTASTQALSFSSLIVNGGNSPPTVGTAFQSVGSSTVSYSGGPFIILAKDAQKAVNAWNQWAAAGTNGQFYKTVQNNVYNTVKVHYLSTDTTMDIRHQIYTRPVIAVSNLDGNAPTQTAMLGCIYQNATRQCPRDDGYGWGDIFGSGSAGCAAFQPQDHAGLDWGTHYQTYDCGSQVAALTATTCLTTFSEPHWEWNAATGPSYIAAMKSFINSGANFFAQCASLQSYENAAGTVGEGTFMSNYGVEAINPSDGIDPAGTVTNYPDIPVCQYVGEMTSAITGADPDWYDLFASESSPDSPPASLGWVELSGTTGPNPGVYYNNFKANAFPLVTNSYTSATRFNIQSRNNYVATGAKYNIEQQLGSNIWYLGGHTWVGVNSAGAENGRRFFFNAILVPAARPAACGFTFCSSGDTCTPQDACHTCGCNAGGTGFIQTPIANCCLSNADCPGTCQECNTATHQCVLTPGCCNVAAGIDCANCDVCTSGVCTAKAGCCFNITNACGTAFCAQCLGEGVSSGCQTLPEPQCCETGSATACTSTPCMTCASNHSCQRQVPLTSCCLANSDCGTDPCTVCNVDTHQCYAIPGCCTENSQCGSTKCIECTSNHTCVNVDLCCVSSSQCGACQQCDITADHPTCIPSSDPNCCVEDADCGSCRRCAQGNNGTHTCVDLSECCLTTADCENCQNCTNSQCTTIDGCCRFDTDCTGCDVCEDFNCVADQSSLSCCEVDNDCVVASQLSNNQTDCGWVCNLPTGATSNTSVVTGVCQSVCTSGKDWTGLIVGLAAGVPLGLLFLLGLGAAIAAFLYMKRDLISGKFFNRDNWNDAGAQSNPAHESATKVFTSGL